MGLSQALRSRPFKILVSGLLFAFVLWKVDVRHVSGQIQSLDLRYMAAALAMFALSGILGGFQWNYLLKGQGIQLGVRRVMSFYFVGLFFNNFLPANLGGDVVRVYDVYRSAGRVDAAVASTFVDRLLGFVALAAMAVLSSLACLSLVGGYGNTLLLISLSLVGLLAFSLLLLFERRVARLFGNLIGPLLFGFREKIKGIYEAIYQYREKKGVLLRALGIAFLVQALRVLVNYQVALALGIRVPVVYFFLFIPIIAVLISFPISFGGVGVRELSAVFLFAQATPPVGEAGAFSMQLLGYMIQIAVSLVGGIIFLKRGEIDRLGAIEAGVAKGMPG